MAKIASENESRKVELIEAASELIYSIGYEDTTVEKIHQHVGVSKGAFYYYFKTKEEIVDAMIQREIMGSLAELDQVINDPNASTPGRLSMFFRFIRNWKVSDIEKIRDLLRILYSDKNIFVRHRNRILVNNLASPALSEIIRTGAKSGFFRTTASSQLVDLVMRIGFEFNDAVAELVIDARDGSDSLKRIESTVALYQDALAGILGAPAGSIRIINREFLKMLMKSA